jgi:hypothetical protein
MFNQKPVKTMKNYSLTDCEKLVETYLNQFGGQIIQINEGILGIGQLILYGAKGKKTIVVTEYFINSWQSGHDIKMFNKTPKKYQKLIDLI